MAITNLFENLEQQRAANRRARNLWRAERGLALLPEEEAINRAPPVHERPWNMHPQDAIRGVEAAHWEQMQRAMMADIEVRFPEPPPINREGVIRREMPRADIMDAMQGGWIPNPWVARTAEEDNIQGKVYGEDYS